MNVPATPEEWKIALQQCAKEKIQFIGHIQAGGGAAVHPRGRGPVRRFLRDWADLAGWKPSVISGGQQLEGLLRRVKSWQSQVPVSPM